MDEALPPFIATSDPGSFAVRTIVERKPKILAQVLETNDLGPVERNAVEALGRELREGVIRDPLDGPRVSEDALAADERAAWKGQIALHAGRSWLDVPWFFAEAFFYLELLRGVGYFSGARRGADPFARLKERELSGPQGGLEWARHLQGTAAPSRDEGKLRLALLSSLWGNRVDLSNFEIPEMRGGPGKAGPRGQRTAPDGDGLIVDHTVQALAALRGARSVHFVLDNAGPELVSDLFLAGLLLGRTTRVTFHAKRMPFFVSDATSRDVHATIDALAADADPRASSLGCALAARLGDGALSLRDHWFWTAPLHFDALPADLASELGDADLIVIKGDANYRRLLEDRKWETSRTMEEIVRSFPRPFLCLRTMKSEIVVDVPSWRAAELSAADPDWLINGRRGIVRYCGAGPAC